MHGAPSSRSARWPHAACCGFCSAFACDSPCSATFRPPGGRPHGGFALPLVLLTLVIVSTAVAGGVFIARSQFRSSSVPLRSLAGLYAAESGLALAMERLGAGQLDSLSPGASMEVAGGELRGGASFVVRLTRLDEGLEAGPSYYVLRSWGWPRGAWGGRRQVARFLKRSSMAPGCCAAALSTRGGVSLSDSGRVSGLDRTPAIWDAAPDACDGVDLTDRAGVAFDSTGSLLLGGSALLTGSPPLLEPAPGELARGGSWLREVAMIADVRLRPGDSLTAIGPALTGSGDCDRRRPANWGNPREVGHACFDYVPLIHAPGDLTINSEGSGQGILAVEGDLSIVGDFEFYGLVLVGGRLAGVTGRGRLVGGVVVLNSGGTGSEVGGGVSLEYSTCAVKRAARSSKLYLPHPLAQFSWVEILD